MKKIASNSELLGNSQAGFDRNIMAIAVSIGPSVNASLYEILDVLEAFVPDENSMAKYFSERREGLGRK